MGTSSVVVIALFNVLLTRTRMLLPTVSIKIPSSWPWPNHLALHQQRAGLRIERDVRRVERAGERYSVSVSIRENLYIQITD